MTGRIQPSTIGSELDNHTRRIRALEANPGGAGCCPGEWIIPTLLNDWANFDDDCPFMYRWGPFEGDDTVNESGIEFSGQITGGVSGSIIMEFPVEDRFDCNKDFAIIMYDGATPQMTAVHIEASTGEMSASWPI